MDKTARNIAFEENQQLITGCVKRNYPLIAALRIEVEDVVQDLSLRMCRSIERYDGNRCRSLPMFLYHELQHEILDMRRRHKPHGIVGVPRDARLDVVYLDQPLEDGAYFEIPVEEDFNIDTYDVVDALPADERAVVVKSLRGEPVRKSAERGLLESARAKLSAYFPERNLMYVQEAI